MQINKWYFVKPFLSNTPLHIIAYDSSIKLLIEWRTAGSLILEVSSSSKAEVSRTEILSVQVAETSKVVTSDPAFPSFHSNSKK